ncbi:ligand-binding sensor domain-containing protein [Melioribacter sp. Ez-97]|uniref:ligand-binding sensor domain-containing protein n=1 Tax=Melioribacter sp. Ez-97 TaxID=3423434 RepID=UPI003EDA8F09
MQYSLLKYYRLIAITASVLFAVGTIEGQSLDPSKKFSQYVIEKWTNKDGLPQNSVYGIMQSKDGFLWFGTEEGFVRYDGVRFEVFSSENIGLMNNNLVVAMLEDSKGVLWAGTFGGLLKYSENEVKLYDLSKGLSNNSVRALFEDEYGRIWAGTSSGLNIIDGDSVKTYSVNDGLTNDYIYKITGDKKGKVYLATRTGGVNVAEYDLNGVKFSAITAEHGLSSNFIRSVYLDSKNQLWVGTFQSGIELIKDGKPVNFEGKEKLKRLSALDFIEDEDGIIYIGAESGLYRLNKGRVDSFILSSQTNYNNIIDLFFDREGNLWLGTYSNGLYKIHEGRFTAYAKEEGLPENFVLSVIADKKSVWVSTRSNNITRIVDGQVYNYVYKSDPDLLIQTYAVRNDTLWMGTNKGLYFYVNGKAGKIKKEECDNCSQIYALYVDKKNNLWVGTDGGGLFLYERGKLVGKSIDEKSSLLRVRFITEDESGNLLLGTAGNGFIIYKDGVYKYYEESNGFPSNLVRHIIYDNEGTIWIATSGKGILRIKNGIVRQITRREGLPTDAVHAIAEDGNGFIWGSGNGGIFRASKSELNGAADGRIKSVYAEKFGSEDGMKNNECNGGVQGAVAVDSSGKIWFPTIQGVVSVDPKSQHYSEYVPPVKIRRVLFDFEPSEISDNMKAPVGTSIIRFDFIAPSFCKPEKIKYKYKLEGYENEWNVWENRRSVIYYNLEPGEYTFRITSANQYGIWGNHEAKVNIYIPPAVYQTLYFKIVSPLLLIGLIYLIIKLRVKKQEKQTALLERIVEIRTEELKNEIKAKEAVQKELKEYAEKLEELNKTKDKFFSIISHDLRNPLYSIASSADFLMNNRKELKDGEIDELINLIKNSTLLLNNLIENLLAWARIQTGRIEYQKTDFDISESINNIVALLQTYAGQKEIKIEFIPGSKKYVFADKTAIESVLLNLLSNAIKFSYPGGSVTVKTKDLNGSHLEVCVEDNGIGIGGDDLKRIFDPNVNYTQRGTQGEKGTGLGLLLCKEHIENNGGELRVESELGKGAKFYFTIPLSKR